MTSRVAITENMDIEKSIFAALDLLKGLRRLFRGKKVAIKPNDGRAVPEDLSGCTHPDTLRAVIRYIKNFEPETITVTGGSAAQETPEVFSIVGLDKVISEEGVLFFDHNKPPFKPVLLWHGPKEMVMVNPHILHYETLVSLAQLKIHELTGVSLGMKNIALSYPAADFYGHPRESQMHQPGYSGELHSFIVSMCRKFPIDLSIIAGHPAIWKDDSGRVIFESGLLIASRDPVAADSVGAFLLEAGPVQHIREAASQGLGNDSPEKIVIDGIDRNEALSIFRKRRDSAKTAPVGC